MNGITSAPVAQRRVDHTAGLALLVAAMAAATLLTVWTMQRAGYVPCELCLAERNPYYGAVPLAVLTAWAARRGLRLASLIGFGLLALLFLASAGLAAYHTGVEWQVWAGPSGCSGAIDAPAKVTDFLKQLETVKVVRCDAPALVLFGLSLAGWNVLMSLLLCGLSAWGAAVTRRAMDAVPTAL